MLRLHRGTEWVLRTGQPDPQVDVHGDAAVVYRGDGALPGHVHPPGGRRGAVRVLVSVLALQAVSFGYKSVVSCITPTQLRRSNYPDVIQLSAPDTINR